MLPTLRTAVACSSRQQAGMSAAGARYAMLVQKYARIAIVRHTRGARCGVLPQQSAASTGRARAATGATLVWRQQFSSRWCHTTAAIARVCKTQLKWQRHGIQRRHMTSASRASRKARKNEAVDVLDPEPFPEHYVPSPPQPPSATPHSHKLWMPPVAIATLLAVAGYMLHVTMNTPRVRLMMEEFNPELVKQLESLGILYPFERAVLAIDRSQLAERIFVTITAGHESHVDKEEVYKVAQVIGSDELELTVKSILATRRLDDRDYLVVDQFRTLVEQRANDVTDRDLYFSVRDEYGLVPLPRRLKVMLMNLHDVVMVHNRGKFTVANVHELCEKLALPFDADEEDEAEMARMAERHIFLNYFAEKFEGEHISSSIARVNALLQFTLSHEL